MLKKNKKELKQMLISTIMNDGKKSTVEKSLIKSFKIIQKNNSSNIIEMLKESIIRSTPTFKVNQQVLKKGKRKTKQELPFFIKSKYHRIVMSLKNILSITQKKQDLNTFHKKFANEILLPYSKSKSAELKNEVQKQVLMKKRYLHKFRW